MSSVIRTKPLSPEERVVKYSEHAAQFDVHKYLDLEGRKLDFIRYYNLDIFCLFLLCGFIVLRIFYMFVVCVCKACTKSSLKQKSQ
jgi:hypothetical protein